MNPVEELVKNNSKAELQALAEEYELPTEGTKQDLAETIVKFESGVPLTAEIEVIDDESIEEVVVEAKPAQAAQGDFLVRFVGKNPVFETNGLVFRAKKPFTIVPADKIDGLLEGSNSAKFRVATPNEAREFYS
jgi:hypothetical protein